MRLFEAAIPLFARKGYAATSVRDIVRAAGVTAPSLYHHFGSKEGLFRAFVLAAREALEQVRREATEAGGSAAERIRRLCRGHFGLRRESPHVAWAVARMLSDPPALASAANLRALATELVRDYEVLVQEGVAGGEFRPCVPRHVAWLLVGAGATAAWPFLHESENDRAEEDLEGMLSVILSGIAAQTR